MQSFVKLSALSPSFDFQSPTTLVSREMGRLLGYPRVGPSFEGRSVTTDIEVVPLLVCDAVVRSD